MIEHGEAGGPKDEAVTDQGRSRVTSSAQSVESRLRGLAAVAAELATEAPRVAQAEHQRVLQAQRDAHAAADGLEGGARSWDSLAMRDAAVSAVSTVQRAAEQLAPGLASLAPDAAEWRSSEFIGTGAPSCVRVGVLDVPSAPPVPVFAPLLTSAGWCVRADRAESAHQVLQGAALRLIACAHPLRLKIDTFDPRLAGTMGLLGQLTAKSQQVVPRSLSTVEELQRTLSALVDISSSRAARLAQLGLASFDELLREADGIADPHRVVVLFDYPTGIDVRAQRDLVRLAATGARRGISFLVHHDPTIAAEHGVERTELTSLLDAVAVAGEAVELSRLPGVPVRLDPHFEADLAGSVCDVVAEMSERAALPSAGFTDTLPDRAQWWLPVADELKTVIGYDDRTPAVIRLRSGNPPLPHVLVGGAVGQGKSNLLLVLIHGLAVRYGPGDLEMYLLDFKHGLEFSALGPSADREHWLPHIKVLGVHSDRPFGLAVLRHLNEELTRRSELFKGLANVADIAEVPAGPDRPARILVVLDEFQVLLQEDDDLADEAARLLERLVRLGRAYGVHVVLATQTIEGVQRLATRRDSIFGQVPYRIALKTTPTDSQAILRTGNSAAADLQFRGEAILNPNYGSPDDNRRVLVTFADKVELDELRRELWTKTAGDRPPRVFQLGASADLIAAMESLPRQPRSESAYAWVGMPITVAEDPAAVEVRAEPGSGLLVLGDGPAEALGVLGGVAVSCAVTASTPPRFLLVDGTASDDALAEAKAALVGTLQTLGCEVEIVDRAPAVRRRLFELRELVRSGGPRTLTYLLGLGMHGLPGMMANVEGGFESPASALQEVVKNGPAGGLVTFGWWNRLHVCTEQLGYGRANVAAHLFLRHPQEGVRSVCGPLVRWGSEQHRGLLWDGMSTEPLTVVPFAPVLHADVARLVRGLA